MTDKLSVTIEVATNGYVLRTFWKTGVDKLDEKTVVISETTSRGG